MTEISVVIPSYNHPEKIFQCVKSILKQEVEEGFEILVVDSSSETHQARIGDLCAIDDRIQLIKLSQQTYPGAARNIGIEKAKGNIIALIDADCVANEGWLKNILANIQPNVILTGVIKNGTENNMVGTCSYLVEFNNFLEFNETRREINAAATCNFSARKEVFEKVGGFSDDRAFEDILFCHRFKKSGGEIHQIKNISVSHINKTDIKGVVQNQNMLGRFSAKVRKKNDMPPELIFKVPFLAFALIGFRYLSIFSRVVSTKHIFKFLLFSPVIIYLLIWWSVGFYDGAKEK